MAEGSNYWQRITARRLSRRTLLRGAAAGLAGISGAALLACGTTKRSSPAGSSGSASTGAGQPRTGGTFNI
jgi:hypothetical protein